ncbi:hypothetical protein F2P81_001544 [Scophthalmus maximus]|uniref:Uncharacterized protein n=1 Tax=Scophthalmus maximus TaxID=52904 RepID=A0A6A4TIC8_SCOMX|nr:hypothetical protein F2P81_001544 [Scophthalmus maximus]
MFIVAAAGAEGGGEEGGVAPRHQSPPPPPHRNRVITNLFRDAACGGKKKKREVGAAGEKGSDGGETAGEREDGEVRTRSQSQDEMLSNRRIYQLRPSLLDKRGKMRRYRTRSSLDPTVSSQATASSAWTPPIKSFCRGHIAASV